MPLQRVMTDFGADNAFNKVPQKLNEHYGIDMPESTIRHTTLNHALEMVEQRDAINLELKKQGEEIQIGEIDGSMIPIVEPDENAKDKRKNKKLLWKEARLSIVICAEIDKNRKFGVEFQESVDKAGIEFKNCAILAGYGENTQIHCVGDGAKWIANQVKKQFGNNANYLIDFYHVCEYLADAAKICAPNESKKWIEKQKIYLKNSEYEKVLEELKKHIEPEKTPEEKAFVRKCYRYLNNRKEYLDYKNAIKNNLPIGSGEIESANGYVVQERLKLSGAWWIDENANAMLTLRVVRANNLWDKYWGKNKADDKISA